MLIEWVSLLGVLKKMPSATIFCSWKLYSIRGKFLHAQSSAWKYMPGIKVYLSYEKPFLHGVTFEGLT